MKTKLTNLALGLSRIFILIPIEASRSPNHSFSKPQMNSAATPRLNFVVQHLLVSKEALIGCFVAMSFSRSVVEVLGD
jgi:hypothetical protein